jgi:hypothetical protein
MLEITVSDDLKWQLLLDNFAASTPLLKEDHSEFL